MTLSKFALFALPIMALGVLAADCSSTNLTPPKHDSGSDVPVMTKRDSGSDTPATLPMDAAHDAPITPPHDSGPDQANGPGGCSGHATGATTRAALRATRLRHPRYLPFTAPRPRRARRTTPCRTPE